MVRIFCLSRTASPDNETRLQTTDINKTFDLHIKFVYEVIALHQPQKKCSSKIWQSNVAVFQPLHQIEPVQGLEVQGYELVRSDHPLQLTRGGVCIYFRNSLPLKILNIHYLQESISFELQVGSKICKFVSLYRSPSHTSDDLTNLQIILSILYRQSS